MLTAQLLVLAQSIDFAAQRRAAAAQFGAEAIAAIEEWEETVLRLAREPVQTQLTGVNAFFNERARWTTDEDIYQQPDYWATPLELLARRAADCEDYAIAKYLTLLALGVGPDELRLVYVKARLPTGVQQAHMVVAWYRSPQSEPLILDNLNPQILAARQRSDLVPVFSFSATELWIRGNELAPGYQPRQRMSRWRDLLERASKDGFKPDW